MFVKKFEASSLDQALYLVKDELGPNALILSTQQKKMKWYQKPMVEVTAAFEKKKEQIFDDRLFDEKFLMEIFPHRKRKQENAGPKTQARSDREEEFPSPRPKKTEVTSYERGFLDMGLSPELAQDFTRQLLCDYSTKDLSNAQFLEKLKTKCLSTGIKISGPETLAEGGDWVVVGVAGSGKTSLLVKLACFLKKDGVSLLGFDKRKMMGNRELSGYAKLIGVPFFTEKDTKSKIKLVDTPALSLTPNAVEMEELERLCAGRKVLLVLEATSRKNELLHVIEKSASLFPSAIAFTKLDLVTQCGVIYECLKASKLPLLGVSLSQSFIVPFKFLELRELGILISKGRLIA